MLVYGVLLAITAAACSASAVILQAVGARRLPPYSGVDPRLLLRLVRSRPYAAGLVLDAASCALNLIALRSLPLFLVQAIASANLALVATLATLVLRTRLRTRDWCAVAGVVCGVCLLVISARPGPADTVPAVGGGPVLVAALAIGAVALLPGRRLRGAAVPGLLAGLTFGAAAIAGRVIAPDLYSLPTLATSPLTYALLVGGLVGTLLYATALQRGSATAASAMTIVGQTTAPAVAGWLILGDGFRSGFAGIAVAGFVLTVTAAIALAPAAHAPQRSAPAGGWPAEFPKESWEFPGVGVAAADGTASEGCPSRSRTTATTSPCPMEVCREDQDRCCRRG